MKRNSLVFAAGALAALFPVTALASDTVLTLSNQVTGNSIIALVRRDDGTFVQDRSYPTGGLGTGAGTASQGAISVNKDGSAIVVVNPGSNSISLFSKDGDDLQFLDVEPSGGVHPISVTQSGPFVYVLNAGDSNNANNIQEFFRFRGHLVPIPDGTATLSGPAVGPAEISFNPSGDALVVTEKGTNLIDTFSLDWFDRPTAINSLPSNGATPYGFSFAPHGVLLVSEAFGGAAGASALSSYRLLGDLLLKTLSPSVATKQTAACWAATSPNGKFVYTSNTGSGNVSGYWIAPQQGTVGLLNPSGVSGVVGGSAIDSAFSPDGKYFFVLSGGTNTVTEFQVNADGSLVKLNTLTGLPTGVAGLAVD